MARLHERVKGALRSAFGGRTRYNTPLPNPQNQQAPHWFAAGPVFNPGADGAIFRTKLSKPWQVIYGYAYRVANPSKYTAYQENVTLYAPKGVPLVGINIQTGWTPVTTPAVNEDGTFAAEDGVYAGESGIMTAEGENWAGETYAQNY